MCIVFSVVVFLWALTFGLTLGSSKVTVLREETVGIYDAKVIKGDASSSLVTWLKGNGLQFAAADQPVLDGYIRKGWVFVVAGVKKGEKRRASTARDGLVDPLILRFSSQVPTYPLALTGTTETPTQVLLYTLSRSKLDARGLLPLRFAGRTEAGGRALSRLADYPKSTWQALPWERDLPYLCKFKGTLGPEQMKADLVLAPVANDEPIRERVLVW